MADAIIFIPGIKGTKLIDVNTYNYDYIWTGIQSNFETIEDLELTLINAQGMLFEEKVDTIIGKGEIESWAYKEIVFECKRNFPKLPLFIFNYDWRFSAAHNGSNLHKFITYLGEKGKALKKPRRLRKFHFITHSLGNFILRNYIKNQGFKHIDKIVFTAPPFLGSIDIVSTILMGEGWFSAKHKIRKLIRTFPGALELLPTYPRAAVFADNGKGVDLFKATNWQSNVTDPRNPYTRKFLQNLQDSWRVVAGELFDLSQTPAEKRQDIMILAGSGEETTQQFKVIKNPVDQPSRNYFDLENAKRSEDGDGRVSLKSSLHYASCIQTIRIKSSWYNKISHAFFLNDNRAQKLIKVFLQEKKFSFDYNKYIGSTIEKVES